VDKQTKGLQARLNQLHTVAEISSEIIKTLDNEALIYKVVDLIKSSFDLYYVGVFLIDDFGEYAVLKAGSGEEGQKMIAAEHKLAINGPSMIGWATGKKQPRIALDVGEDAVHFSNPYLPFTHSEMAIPLIGKNERVLGALTIQSHRQNDFDEDDVLIIQNVANSLAVALENAELFQKSQQSLKEIEALNALYIQRTWSDFLIKNPELSANYEAPQAVLNATEELNSIIVPIKLRNQIIGEIEIEVPASKLKNFDTNLIDVLSDQIAYAMENTRLMEQTIQQAAQEQKANELSTEFFKAVRIEDVIRTAIQEISSIPYVSEVNIQLDPNSTGSTHNWQED
jgi:GAF domain-containing protein